jgi:uncharacterized protein YlxW (UPF0749 family)
MTDNTPDDAPEENEKPPRKAQPAKKPPAKKQPAKKQPAKKQPAKKTEPAPVAAVPPEPDATVAQPEVEVTSPADVTSSATPVRHAPSGWRQLLEISRPRATRGQLIVALLCGLLGFALVTQVHSQAGNGLSSARQADLVDVLDNLSAKSDQLRSQITDEQNALTKLTGGAGQNQAALDEAQQRAQTLRILAGTVGATGPGIDLRIDDPDKKITADVLLDSLEELRDAGAEAVEIRGGPARGSGGSASSTASPGAPLAVRLVASSYFVDALDGSGVVVDGTELDPPYDLLAIGDPPTLSQAMGIPGGVLDTLKGKGASGTVTELDTVRITALHSVTPPKYAHPASTTSAGG